MHSATTRARAKAPGPASAQIFPQAPADFSLDRGLHQRQQRAHAHLQMGIRIGHGKTAGEAPAGEPHGVSVPRHVAEAEAVGQLVRDGINGFTASLSAE